MTARGSRRRSSSARGRENFTLLVDRDHDGADVLHVAGELDLANLSRFRRVLDGLFEQRPATVEVDLTHVELIETVTAAALVRAQSDALRHGTRLRLTGATGSVAVLLRLAASRLSQRDPG